jgi:arabinofuranan 3-O-arabinosyltransferase
MSIIKEPLKTPGIGTASTRRCPRLLGIFATWRLLAYGYTFPVFYAAFFVYLYWRGLWLLDRSGIPVYHDFTTIWTAGAQALHGEAAASYDPVKHLEAQEALVGAQHTRFSVWGYPPTFFLILAPLALLPYIGAFLTWETVTLAGCLSVVHLIVRRPPAIALALASPYTAWNFLIGQTGFLTASLLGGSLLFLDRRPVLAGVFIGCLTYKPQFGILFPVALLAAKQWLATISATATFGLLAGASIVVFGAEAWAAFPRQFVAQAGVNLFADPDSHWAYLQTVYGLVRYVKGDPVLAWLVQGATTCGAAVIVWLVWRSPARYALKAATLSAAALTATPYAFAYDLAVIAVPVAFLAKDQIDSGLLRGEQTIMLLLFVAALWVLPTAGRLPLGALIPLALLSLILRRLLDRGKAPAAVG